MSHITPKQLEQEFNITRRHQCALRSSRQLPYFKVGHRSILYARTDVERFLARRKIQAVNVEGRS